MTNPIEQQARELKPCPFCGGPAQIWHQKKNHREQTYVLCNEALCGTSKSGVGGKRADREADAIASWNRRALTPTGENAKHVEVKAEFEKWAVKRHGLSVEKWADSGEYKYHDTRCWYECWKAARALSAPDNAEAICQNCDRLTEIRHCQACGCDFTNPSTAATADKAEAMFHLRSYGDVTERELLELANPTPTARVSVSDEDLEDCQLAAQMMQTEGFGEHADGSRRLVQAVKGEG